MNFHWLNAKGELFIELFVRTVWLGYIKVCCNIVHSSQVLLKVWLKETLFHQVPTLMVKVSNSCLKSSKQVIGLHINSFNVIIKYIG